MGGERIGERNEICLYYTQINFIMDIVKGGLFGKDTYNRR